MKINNRKSLKTCLGSIFSILIFLTACQQQSKKKALEQIFEEPTKEIKTPKDILSLNEADSLYTNYTKRRAENIATLETTEGSKPFQPSRFISFNLETVKEYIAYVEQEAKKGGTRTDSLRIYLGNYGNAKGAKQRHNTVFLLPSAQIGEEYGGIYINTDGKAELIRNLFKEIERKDTTKIGSLKLSNTNGLTSLILNFGGCCHQSISDF